MNRREFLISVYEDTVNKCKNGFYKMVTGGPSTLFTSYNLKSGDTLTFKGTIRRNTSMCNIQELRLTDSSGSTYNQMPFETITEQEYCNWLVKYPSKLYLEYIDFSGSEDTRKGEASCSANGCEIT